MRGGILLRAVRGDGPGGSGGVQGPRGAVEEGDGEEEPAAPAEEEEEGRCSAASAAGACAAAGAAAEQAKRRRCGGEEGWAHAPRGASGERRGEKIGVR